MIQYQLKLKLTNKQEKTLNEWLWILTGVWNWAVRKIELDARDKRYYSIKKFNNLLAGHSVKVGVPSHSMQGILSCVHMSWQRCFKKISKKPNLKGTRNRLRSIPFPDPFNQPKANRIDIPGLGSVRFHSMVIASGRIKCGRVIKRSSGWYLCLVIDAGPKPVFHVGDGQIGIDPGFQSLLTLSTGEKINHPREFEHLAKRLAQAQRGNDKQLASRLHERIANQRKDRNHKLSRRLVAENKLIAFSDDSPRKIRCKFGKSVLSSGHFQLRQMLAYKCRTGGRQYVEVSSFNSTKTCSSCGALTGPTGWAGLKVRQWCCSGCGTLHDRDVNAAINTLLAGVGRTLETVPLRGRSGIHSSLESQYNMVGVSNG